MKAPYSYFFLFFLSEIDIERVPYGKYVTNVFNTFSAYWQIISQSSLIYICKLKNVKLRLHRHPRYINTSAWSSCINHWRWDWDFYVKWLLKVHKSLSSKSVIVTNKHIIFDKLNLPWNITIMKKKWKHKVIMRIKLTFSPNHFHIVSFTKTDKNHFTMKII